MSDTSPNLTDIIADPSHNFEDNFDIDKIDFEGQFNLAKFRHYISDTADRKWLAIWAAIVVSTWLIIVVIILFLKTSLKLSDTVLSVLLGITTLNILGLTYIVLKDILVKIKKYSSPFIPQTPSSSSPGTAIQKAPPAVLAAGY